MLGWIRNRATNTGALLLSFSSSPSFLRYDGRVNELRQPNTLPAEQHALTDLRVALRDQARGLVTLVGLIHSRSYEVQLVHKTS